MGHQWSIASPGLGESYLPIALGAVLVTLSIGLILTFRSPTNPGIMLWAIVLLLLTLLPALMVLLAYRR
jgi:hypothetical protein